MTLQITGNNMNGSPELSLSAGNSTTFAWSPFGGGAARTGNLASLPGFNGERQDPLSGVTHLGNGYRAYSPALRRFICPDSESPFGEGGINPYVYCDHDPVNNTDPSGHMPKKTTEEMEAATRARMAALNAGKTQAQALPAALPQPQRASGATGNSAAQVRQRAAPTAAVQGASQQRPRLPAQDIKPKAATDFEMAPAYLWAVSHEHIQNASQRRFNVSKSKELIRRATQDEAFFDKTKTSLKYGMDELKNKSEAQVADELDALIAEHGMAPSKTLYRGMPKKFVGKPGTIVQENRFTAATNNRSIAEKFAGSGGQVIKIKGGNPLPIPNVFMGMRGAGESEFLYAKNTRFKVLKSSKTGEIVYRAI
ncbi:hypothetical protein SB6415_00043 [Klebsiella pasteurii]|uniref:RHS repeat-associated core domain-containing protein n=1 Tax=Klebsiella pasteurii TaxID=2587529 RepID=UPI0011588C23|nr:RHS repeat-associated core domain-containing protein [Klebsiella pasteurii]VUS55816.1 hypothetical protein SB6415_00043 [Klebsiella pasteurii]